MFVVSHILSYFWSFKQKSLPQVAYLVYVEFQIHVEQAFLKDTHQGARLDIRISIFRFVDMRLILKCKPGMNEALGWARAYGRFVRSIGGVEVDNSATAALEWRGPHRSRT